MKRKMNGASTVRNGPSLRRKANVTPVPRATSHVRFSHIRAYSASCCASGMSAAMTPEGTSAALDEMNEAQAGIRHIEQEAKPVQRKPRARKQKVRTEVSSAGSSSRRAPPQPPPAYSPPVAAPSVESGAEAESDENDESINLDADEVDGELGGEADDSTPLVAEECKAVNLKSA
eukprot:6188004-Pleurochrysis_carterae.AAC.1